MITTNDNVTMAETTLTVLPVDPADSAIPMVNPSRTSIDDLYKLMEVQVKSRNDQKSSIAALGANISVQGTAITDLGNRLRGIEETSVTASTQSSTAILKANNALLQVEKLNQKLLNKSVEISGVPFVENENTLDLVMKIFSVLGISIAISDINLTFRIGRSIRVNARGQPSYPKIVVDFTRQMTRNSILTAARTFRDLFPPLISGGLMLLPPSSSSTRSSALSISGFSPRS